ncbi:hypothetical protein QJQ45_018077 [Haematococcus lacustris]|nr:hypothetical protein QJQ45_018077 [Haematococcus lacustris]
MCTVVHRTAMTRSSLATSVCCLQDCLIASLCIAADHLLLSAGIRHPELRRGGRKYFAGAPCRCQVRVQASCQCLPPRLPCLDHLMLPAYIPPYLPLQPLRILSPEQNRYILPPATERWSAMSGIDVIVDYRSIPELPGIILDTSSNGQRLYDGWCVHGHTGADCLPSWILDPVVMVDIAQSGMLEPLDAYIAADASIDWPDFIRYFRQVSSVYNGTVTGVPLAGKASTLYYRKDVFAMANLSAPSTWDEFVTIARVLNGSDFNADGVPDHSICWQIINCLEDTVVFSQLLTPMTQALGTKSGWLFDPETMDPLVNNEAMLQALSMYKELLGYTLPLPVESQCSLVHVPFLQGACAMTIKWDEQFKGIQLMDQLFSLPANPWHGRIGFAQLPGSTSVLNRATGERLLASPTMHPGCKTSIGAATLATLAGKLERCTVATCPYATQQRNQFTGQTELINTAPNFGLAGFSGVINALQPSSYKKATFQLFAFLSASNISFPLVIAISPVGPFLNMHTSTEPALLNAWKAAGYFPPDVEHFMQNMNATLANPNVALDIRITSGHLYRQTLSHGLAMLQRGSTAAEVMAWVTAGFAAQLAKDGGPSQVQAAYLAGLNTRLVPRSPAPPQAASPALSTSTSSPDLTVPIAVPTTVCSVVLIVACLAVLVRRSSFAARLFGKSIAPRLGSSVTLLVTDIQDSTTLWETLSQDDMNAAVELHHSLVRKLLVQHHGYESATEGDAFILAFHTPSDALHWAQAFQQGLLHLAWPEQLLQLDAGAPVWAAPGVRQPAVTSCSWCMIGNHADWQTMLASGTFALLQAHAVVGLQKQASLLSSEAAISAGANLPMLSIVVEEANRFPVPLTLSSIQSYRTAYVHRQDFMASASAPIPTRTFYANQWMLAPSKTSDHTRLVFRGLRVRVGLHSGVYEGSDALLNKTTGRMQYGGRPLAMAKAVGDVGQGGMVLLSQSAFEQLPVSKLASFGMLLNMGDYVFTKDESLPATPIYQAFGRGLEHRAAFLQGPLRASEQLQAGVLDAPLGDVSITFANLVGVGTLMAWDKTLASAALDLYHTHAISTLQAMPQLLHQLPGHGGQQPALLPAGTTDPGYLVELSGGLCLAAFLSPAAALLWALQLRADLLEAPWQEELLAHELCEEVAVAQAVDVQQELHPLRPRQEEEGATPQPISKAASLRSEGTGPGPCKLLPVTAEVMSVLFRGPRLKVGVDVGRVHADINPVTARMTYRQGAAPGQGVRVAALSQAPGKRGRVMNRAARIADKAHSGSVWCSQAAWEGCSQACPELMTQLGVKGHSLGQFSLKGVLEPMHLMRMQSDPCKPRFLRGPGSSMAQVATTWHQLHSPQPSPQSCRASSRLTCHAFSVGSCRSAASAAQRGQLGGSITALQLLQAFAVQAGARPASSPYMAELGMGPDLGLMEPKTLCLGDIWVTHRDTALRHRPPRAELFRASRKTSAMSGELAVIDSAAISAEEESKVAQLLKLLQSKPDWAKDIEQPLLDGYEEGLQRPALLRSASPRGRSWVVLSITFSDVRHGRRWLRARKWDVQLAAQCICEHAVWRKTLCGPSHRFTGTEFPVHTTAKKVLLAGPDRSGRPALVGLVRQHFSDTNDPDGFKRFLTYVLDTAVAVGKAKNHYVERLHKLYFYNAPTLFVTTWKLLAPFGPIVAGFTDLRKEMAGAELSLTAEEESKVAQLLKLLQSKPDWAKDIEQPLLDGYEDGIQRPALLRSASPRGRSWVLLSITFSDIRHGRRWLRARKWDVQLAAQCICEHAAWRRTFCGPSHRFTGGPIVAGFTDLRKEMAGAELSLTAEEESKVAQLLKLLQSKPDWAKDIEQPLLDGYEDGLQRPALLRLASPRGRSWVVLSITFSDIRHGRRWLRARKWDVQLAAQCICEHAAWRRTFCGRSHRFTGTEFPVHIAQQKALTAGLDKGKHPSMIAVVDRHIHDDGDQESFKKYISFLLDAGVIHGKLLSGPDWDGKIVGILACGRMGMKNVDLSALKDIFTLLQNHYVERLHKLYFYDPPAIFMALWKVVSPFVSQSNSKGCGKGCGSNTDERNSTEPGAPRTPGSVDPVTRSKVELVYPKQAVEVFSQEFDMAQLPAGVFLGGGGPYVQLPDALAELLAQQLAPQGQLQ